MLSYPFRNLYYRINIVTRATLLRRLVRAHSPCSTKKRLKRGQYCECKYNSFFFYKKFFFMFGQVKHSDKVISREYGRKNDQAEF